MTASVFQEVRHLSRRDLQGAPMTYRARLAAAVLATAFVLPSAGHAAAGCAVLTDPEGDVAVAADAGVAPDGHLDIRSATVQVDGGRVIATIQATKLVEGRLGDWVLEFDAGRRRLVLGAGFGMWVNAGHYSGRSGYFAGVAGRPAQPASGTIDYAHSVVTIDAPLTAFGGLSDRETISGFQLTARETLAFTDVAAVAPYDVATGTKRFRVGTC